MDDLPHKHPGSLLLMLENNRWCHLYTSTTHRSLLNQREMEPAKSRGLQKPPFKHDQHQVNIIPGIGMVSTKGIHMLSRELVLNITTPLRRNCPATTLATNVSLLFKQKCFLFDCCRLGEGPNKHVLPGSCALRKKN